MHAYSTKQRKVGRWAITLLVFRFLQSLNLYRHKASVTENALRIYYRMPLDGSSGDLNWQNRKYRHSTSHQLHRIRLCLVNKRFYSCIHRRASVFFACATPCSRSFRFTNREQYRIAGTLDL
ncbi:hypothetical protein QE152_g26577 [Popillia japonica]|uniref:Secreted protein n=1 Tax=Popillia japonica TaxID=7064 RepID=A0AAW1JWE4_POPJA